MAELLRISVQHLCTGRIDAAYLHGNRSFHRVEIKDRTAREWLRMGNNSIWISLAGKLLPHTAIFFLMGILYNVYLYGSPFSLQQRHPADADICHLCLVLASQGMGNIDDREPCLPCVWDSVSLPYGAYSLSPCADCHSAMGMHPVLQALAICSPAPLFPDLCGPGTEWIPHDLLVGQLRGAAYFHDAPVPL